MDLPFFYSYIVHLSTCKIKQGKIQIIIITAGSTLFQESKTANTVAVFEGMFSFFSYLAERKSSSLFAKDGC
jgi:hypothetical protein